LEAAERLVHDVLLVGSDGGRARECGGLDHLELRLGAPRPARLSGARGGGSCDMRRHARIMQVRIL
jgi:hypothetical protein